MAVLALISDIHGNGVALDAVLADVAAREVDEIVCLGDVAAGGPQPRRVIRRLRELGCRAVRGNADGWLLDGLPAGRSEATRRLHETVAWARVQLGDDDLAYLAALPATLRCGVGGLELLCVHGSPHGPSSPPSVSASQNFVSMRRSSALKRGRLSESARSASSRAKARSAEALAPGPAPEVDPGQGHAREQEQHQRRTADVDGA